jgi:hypothetical protein
MKQDEITSLMRDMAPVIKEYVAAQLSPIVDKIGPLLERVERMENGQGRFDQRLDAICLRGVGAGVDESALVERAVQALVPIIDQRTREAVAAVSIPTIDDIRPVIEIEVANAVARLNQAKPRSGDVQSMAINRKGALIVAMADDWLENLGTVVEHHADEFEHAITVGVRALPRPETYPPR